MAGRTFNQARRACSRTWPIFGLSLVALASGIAGPAVAGVVLPTGGQVAAGSATISASGASGLVINQSSSKAIIDWSSFSIGQGGGVSFDNGSGSTLNRVSGGTASQIDGLLSGTGSVYVINPSGVVIGKSGVVSVGGSFVASTLDVSNASFLAGGDLTFSGASTASVVNEGKVGALGGDVALIASVVSNSGEIDAPGGTAGLVSGYQVVMRDTALDDGEFAVVLGGSGTSVTNSGVIAAANAELRANGGNVYALAGNTAGVIKATGVSQGQGKVYLIAEDGGTLDVAGQIQARGPGGTGGTIETSGTNVTIGSGDIDAGPGGQWLIDPYDLTIDSTAAGTINSALGGGTSVTLQTTASAANVTGANATGLVNPNGLGDITLISPISWSTSATLTLDAYHSVAIDADITVSGSGNLTIKTNDGGSGGELSFGSGDSATMSLSAALQINGVDYTLESPSGLIGAMTSNTAGNYALASSGSAGFSDDASAVSVFSGALEGLGNSLSGVTISITQDNFTGSVTGNNVLTVTSFTGSYPIGPGTVITGLGGSRTVMADGNGTGGAGTYTLTTNGNVSSTSGLTTTATALDVGFIGDLSGTVADLVLSGVSISDTAIYSGFTNDVGGVAGYSTGTIRNVTVTGSVGGGSETVLTDVGGIVGNVAGGAAVGVFTSSYSGTVYGEYYVGGVAGYADATLSGDWSSGTVTGRDEAGGVAGESNYLIGSSYSSATVDSWSINGNDFGGLVGVNLGEITQSYSSGSMTIASGTSRIGGFAGHNEGEITDSYTTESINAPGSFDVGGFVGLNDSGATIQDAYAATATFNAGGGTDVGDFAGDVVTVNSISGAIYDDTLQSSGVGSNGASDTLVVGESTSAMQSASAYATNFAGWNFTSIWSTPSTGSSPSTSYYPELYGVSHVIVLTSDPTSMVYGDNPPTSGPVSAQGLQDNDTAGALSALGNFSTTATSTSPVLGVYTITPPSGDATGPSGTYRIIADVSGTLTITPRPLTVALCTYSYPSCVVEKTYDGGTAAVFTATDFTLSNLATGDVQGTDVTITSTGGTYASDQVLANTQAHPGNVTASGLVLGGPKAPDYTLTTGNVTGAIGVIDPKSVTVSLVGPIDKTYDGTTNAATLTSSNYTLSGVLSADASNVSLDVSAMGNGTYASKDVAIVGGTVQANIEVTYTGAALIGNASSNYVIGSASDPITTVSGAVGEIDPDPLTISITALDKVYDGTANAVLSPTGNYLIGVITTDTNPGNVTGDQVTLTATGGNYSQVNVGNGLSVTITGLALSGNQANDYTIASYNGTITGTGNITPRPVMVDLVGTVAKAYDGNTTATLTASNYDLTNVIAGDTVTINDPTSGTYASPDAGTGIAVTVTGLALTTNPNGDYTLASTTVTGDVGVITAEALTVSLVGNVIKPYDGNANATLTPSNYELTGFPAGLSINYETGNSTGSYDSPTAGTDKTVTVSGITLVGTDATDYTVNSIASAPIGTITALSVTASLTGVIDKTYDGTTTATLGSNYNISGTILGETLTLTALSGNYASKNVSLVSGVVQKNIPVTFTGLQLSGTYGADYVLSSTSVTGDVGEIDPKGITASLTGVVDKTYNDNANATLKASNYILSGVVPGDQVTVTNTSGTYATKDVQIVSGVVQKNIAVTVANLTLGGAQAEDYTVSPTTITGDVGEIDPLAITVALTSTPITKVYDGTTNVTTSLVLGTNYTFSADYAGDIIGLTYTSGTYASKNVGNNQVVRFIGLGLNGAQANDYKLTTTSLIGSVGDITPATLTVSLGPIVKTYDDTTTATLGNYTLGGLIMGDSVSLTAASGSYSQKDVGTAIPVTFTGLKLSGSAALDYTLATTSIINDAVGVINPKAVTVALVGVVSRTYNGSTGAPITPSNYLISGFVVGDTGVGLNDPTQGVYASPGSSSVTTTGIKVTVTGLALTGADAKDYTLANTTISANIGTILK